MMTGARQRIAVAITFRKTSKDAVECQAGTYRSIREKHPIVTTVL